MATTVSQTTTAAAAAGGSGSLQRIKADLTAALIAAGVSDARATDAAPKGFPRGVSWTDAHRMVSRRIEDNNPSTPGNVVLSQDLLKANLAATKTLAELGVADLARFPRGTSVTGAIDALYQDTRSGRLASMLARSGIYDLSAFPAGTSAFAAFKLIEDPANPGKISLDKYREYQAATSALKTLNITSLVNFPRGTTMIEAQKTLEPKADRMLAMLGVTKANFKDPSISSLTAIAILTRLPESIQQMATLPAGQSADQLALQAVAARRLVAMGHDSLAPFAAMKDFAGKTVTPRDAFTVAKLAPAPADLPPPTSPSTERLFQSTAAAARRSFGQPNPVTQSVLMPPASLKVKPNPPATTVTVVTAAQVLEFNRTFWTRNSGSGGTT
ncbi:MAG: hypothetical protein NBV65_07515, partial [Burkholderiaceae bacterium]|nr:hypothetical protein [Burkholderiaceae bacterium]